MDFCFALFEEEFSCTYLFSINRCFSRYISRFYHGCLPGTILDQIRKKKFQQSTFCEGARLCPGRGPNCLNTKDQFGCVVTRIFVEEEVLNFFLPSQNNCEK